MIIYYRVLSKDISNRTALVRYWSDAVSENSVATSINSNGEISRSESGWPLRTRLDYNVSFHSLAGHDEFNLSTENVVSTIERYAPVNLLKIIASSEDGPNNAVMMQNVSNLVNNTYSFESNDVDYINYHKNYTNSLVNTVIDMLVTRGIV
jgi:hypothetical protein